MVSAHGAQTLVLSPASSVASGTWPRLSKPLFFSVKWVTMRIKGAFNQDITCIPFAVIPGVSDGKE